MRCKSMALAAAGAATGVLGAYGPAQASLSWNFTTDMDGGGNGTLTTGPLSAGSYLITGISGTFGGVTITGLPVLSGTDDLLYPAPEYLDGLGIGFSLSNGTDVVLWAEGGGLFFGVETNGQGFRGTFSASQVSPIPEPGTAGILAPCLAALPFVGRRRRASRNRDSIA
jgi:hypothetical protein